MTMHQKMHFPLEEGNFKIYQTLLDIFLQSNILINNGSKQKSISLREQRKEFIDNKHILFIELQKRPGKSINSYM